jgi:hypothetical protein
MLKKFKFREGFHYSSEIFHQTVTEYAKSNNS